MSGSSARRLSSLDGLRGVAAAVVLLHHVLLTWQPLAVLYDDAGAHVAVLPWLLAYTPLHVLWGGGEAVVVFFVLSGFVLVLPLTEARGRWRGYYPRRLVRLYVPVAAAVVLAVYWATIVPRRFGAGASHWLQAQAVAPTVHVAVNDALLLHDPPGILNGPLWSLRWEVWFSLLLPLYALVVLRARRVWPLKLAGLLALTAAGTARGIPGLEYLPIFGVGALIAVEHDGVARLVARLTGRRGWPAAAAALLLLNVDWSSPASHGATGVAGGAIEAAVALGAAAVVALAATWARAARAARRSPLQWLGSRSFSLYLVHLPLILSLEVILRSTPLVAAAGIPLSLALAEAFYRLVEAPAHRLARRLGRAAARTPVEATAPA